MGWLIGILAAIGLGVVFAAPAAARSLPLTATPIPTIAPAPTDAASQVAQIEIAQVDNSQYPTVTLYVRVTDAEGNRVNNLAQEQFHITEDTSEVEVIGFDSVNTQPILTLLVLDKSGSMAAENKLAGAQQASLTFIDLMRLQDQAGFVAFDNGVNLLQDFTSDHDALITQINSVMPGDCTSWYEAIYFSSGLMAKQSGRKSIILLSDGMDCREDFVLHDLQGYGSYHSFEEAVSEAQKAETPIYTISLGLQPAEQLGEEGYDEGRLSRMAVDTGGQYFHAPTSDQLTDLYRTLSEDTQAEYVVTYRSPRPIYDGTRRNIQVTIQANTTSIFGSQTYLEEHLISVQSDWRIAAACLGPLLLAAVLPFGFSLLRQRRSPAAKLNLSPKPQPMCPHCGGPIKPGAKFCPRCGGSLQPVLAQAKPRRCTNCGHALNSTSKFCPSCGQRV